MPAVKVTETDLVTGSPTVVGRVSGTVAGVLIAQSQGFGTLATVGCGAAGYVLGSIADGFLNAACGKVYKVE